MNATTLRGIFPEPKPPHRKNFIKENVRHIKQMQGLLQNSDLFEAKPPRSKQTKLQNKPQINVPNRKLSQTRSLPLSRTLKTAKKKIADSFENLATPEERQVGSASNEKLTHRAVQTENAEDVTKLYESGVIKYPSPALIKILNKQNAVKRREHLANEISNSQGYGDAGNGIVISNPHNDLADGIQSLDINDKHNFIKENIKALKTKTPKTEMNKDSFETYQKGVLPKYLRERKEEQKKELENQTECPEGHVLLPEEERRETLRVLRQSYADRIQELNSMPVRNDTLRMRRRKMAIEEELKKIDEGIKVFQRPKVFVKINA